MSLAAGTRLGPYEILAPLGAGGMGEVYRARDTRLDRIVALKILKSATVDSPDAAARFDREARAIARFSHPHICQLHDVGHDNGTAYLVMELVEGETLASRLAGGPLPFADVQRFGIQMADALDAAHRAGIVHRDLKPGNVMLPKSGLKLLDFGLAKPTGPSATVTPTLAAVTSAGGVAGTIAYMAPEVLDGSNADERSDIYALGAVLYEMATGRRYFGSVPQVITPPWLDAIVRVCLVRDPDNRWQSARDIALQLSAASNAALPPARRQTSWIPWTVAAGLAVLTVAIGIRARGGGVDPAATRSVAFEVPPPEGGEFVDSVESTYPALSPDGSQLAYIAQDGTGVPRVWLRTLSIASARSLAGTDGARNVFWSPNGRSVGFAVADSLKRIDLPDGTPVTITSIPDVRVSASWGADDILYSILPGAIYRVPVPGGSSVPLIEADRKNSEIAAAWPWFLSDGKRFLYLLRRADGSGTIRLGEVGKPSRDVVPAASAAQVLDGKYLVYARESTLVAQPFDLRAGTVSGDPVPIAEPARYFLPTGAATFSASQGGVLAYQGHLERGRLVWLDRAGHEVGALNDDQGYYSRARFSPDGRRILFVRTDKRLATSRVWTYDLDRKVEQPATGGQHAALNPVWTRDGSGIVYAGHIPPHLYQWDASTGAEHEIAGLSPTVFTLAEDITPDGETLVFTLRTPRGSFDLWTMLLADPSKRAVVRETSFDEASARLSPDGRYLAYAANEFGPYDVYVIPMGQPSAPIRVSTAGGSLPRWSRDGRELFYLSGDGWLVSVTVRTTPTFAPGEAHRLFAVRGGVLWADVKPNAGWPDYDVSPDGKQFLAVVPDPANRKPMTALVNWRPNASR